MEAAQKQTYPINYYSGWVNNKRIAIAGRTAHKHSSVLAWLNQPVILDS